MRGQVPLKSSIMNKKTHPDPRYHSHRLLRSTPCFHDLCHCSSFCCCCCKYTVNKNTLGKKKFVSRAKQDLAQPMPSMKKMCPWQQRCVWRNCVPRTKNFPSAAPLNPAPRTTTTPFIDGTGMDGESSTQYKNCNEEGRPHPPIPFSFKAKH